MKFVLKPNTYKFHLVHLISDYFLGILKFGLFRFQVYLKNTSLEDLPPSETRYSIKSSSFNSARVDKNTFMKLSLENP